MFKTLAVIAVLGLIYYFSGYTVHAENLPYYIKAQNMSAIQEVTFKDGKKLSGIVTDKGESISINTDGAGMLFSKAEVQSMTGGKAANPLEGFIKNAQAQQKTHPLIKKDRNSLSESWDNMLTEPGDIAKQIRQRNPGVSISDRLAQARGQAAAVQAAQNKTQNAFEQAHKEMKENYEPNHS